MYSFNFLKPIKNLITTPFYSTQLKISAKCNINVIYNVQKEEKAKPTAIEANFREQTK